MVTRDDVVECQVHIDARPETVFRYFTDPARMIEWKGVEAKLEPRPGGVYRVDINGRDVALGTYVLIDPPRRIVFTWGWEENGHPVPPGSSTVEIDLIPDGEGTLLKLRHSGLRGPARQQHSEGWVHYLERLSLAAAGKDPGWDSFRGPQHQGTALDSH